MYSDCSSLQPCPVGILLDAFVHLPVKLVENNEIFLHCYISDNWLEMITFWQYRV